MVAINYNITTPIILDSDLSAGIGEIAVPGPRKPDRLAPQISGRPGVNPRRRQSCRITS